MKTLRPLFFIVSLLLLVGLACNGGAAPTQQPPTQPVQVEQPTEPPPTEVVVTDAPATEAPTEAPVSEAQPFFTEEFDAFDPNNWDVLTVTASEDADPEKVTVEPEDGKLIWDFDSEWLYYYLFYNAFDYEDVRLEVRADNRGRNNNSVSLICRYDPEVGWYEFNIANNGLYAIVYWEVTSSDRVNDHAIANGGSNDIKQGKEVNEYAITCQDDELTLEINGEEVQSIREKNYGLRSGQVGVSVKTFNVLPILIEMDWFKISEP